VATVTSKIARSPERGSKSSTFAIVVSWSAAVTAVGGCFRSFHHGGVGEAALLHHVCQGAADRAVRSSASPKHGAHFEVADHRLRENVLNAKAIVVRVRHAGRLPQGRGA
jgi:hypothetical protein